MKVLFVCLGNICRSPAAEGIFRKMVEQAALSDQVTMDSAGTGGWHAGSPPDGRMIEHARNRGYDLTPLRARQFNVKDFEDFDLIVTMDYSNFENVSRLIPSLSEQRGRTNADASQSATAHALQRAAEANIENGTLVTDPRDSHNKKIRPMVSYCKIHQVSEVPDPYHRQADGFELVLDILEDACAELLAEVKTKLKETL